MGKPGHLRQHAKSVIHDQDETLNVLRVALSNALWHVNTEQLRTAVQVCGCGPLKGDCGNTLHRWWHTANYLSTGGSLKQVGQQTRRRKAAAQSA